MGTLDPRLALTRDPLTGALVPLPSPRAPRDIPAAAIGGRGAKLRDSLRGATPAQVPNFDNLITDCGADWLRVAELLVKRSNASTGFASVFVDLDPVPVDQYWIIYRICGAGPGGTPPPEAGNALVFASSPAQKQMPVLDSTSNFNKDRVGVALASGPTGPLPFFFTAQVLQKFILPPGWFVWAAVDSSGGFPTIGFFFDLHMMIFRLPMTLTPPMS